MKPKEEAKQLVDKFLNQHKISGGLGMNFKQAKQCALICVYEIIKQINPRTRVKYWREVKQEIQNYETKETI